MGHCRGRRRVPCARWRSSRLWSFPQRSTRSTSPTSTRCFEMDVVANEQSRHTQPRWSVCTPQLGRRAWQDAAPRRFRLFGAVLHLALAHAFLYVSARRSPHLVHAPLQTRKAKNPISSLVEEKRSSSKGRGGGCRSLGVTSSSRAPSSSFGQASLPGILLRRKLDRHLRLRREALAPSLRPSYFEGCTCCPTLQVLPFSSTRATRYDDSGRPDEDGTSGEGFDAPPSSTADTGTPAQTTTAMGTPASDPGADFGGGGFDRRRTTRRRRNSSVLVLE